MITASEAQEIAKKMYYKPIDEIVNKEIETINNFIKDAANNGKKWIKYTVKLKNESISMEAKYDIVKFIIDKLKHFGYHASYEQVDQGSVICISWDWENNESKKFLLTFNDTKNKLYFQGFVVCNSEEECKDTIAKLVDERWTYEKAKKLYKSIDYHIGSFSLIYNSFDDFESQFNIIEISSEEYETIKKYFGDKYGYPFYTYKDLHSAYLNS